MTIIYTHTCCICVIIIYKRKILPVSVKTKKWSYIGSQVCRI